MQPILPEICWKVVEDWEIEWIDMRAMLLQQPQPDLEITNFQTEQEITAISAEIQAKIEEDQEIQAEINEDPEIKHKTANQQFSKEELEEDLVSTHNFIIDSKSQAEAELEVLTDAETREDDWNAPEVDAADESIGKSAHRPPPKPLNLSLEVVVGNKAADQCLTTMPAVSEGNKVTDLNKGTDVVAKGMRRMSLVGAAIRRAMLLNQPPLMAAMFPWNRHKVSAVTAGNGAKDCAFSKGKMEDVVNGGSNAKICVIAMAKDEALMVEGKVEMAAERRRTLVQYRGKEEKVLRLESSGTAGGKDSHRA
ncbi:hypothetical protein PIB30_083188 [Stylosanthes scabra]|uniref:Uncharacterized protein n=1 Tax=Stylosanthes scabra TaxID=79078 RepID=A0ABU6VQQ0_9FABA|nr:hypothetical protein [Stylosanthes scabra]